MRLEKGEQAVCCTNRLCSAALMSAHRCWKRHTTYTDEPRQGHHDVPDDDDAHYLFNCSSAVIGAVAPRWRRRMATTETRSLWMPCSDCKDELPYTVYSLSTSHKRCCAPRQHRLFLISLIPFFFSLTNVVFFVGHVVSPLLAEVNKVSSSAPQNSLLGRHQRAPRKLHAPDITPTLFSLSSLFYFSVAAWNRW
jgi:hypothetical protein